MLGLFWLAFKNQWSANMKKPFEFFPALVAMILNNSFYLYGIYLLAILNTKGDPYVTKEYLLSTGMVLIAWGMVNVFGGGLCQLGALIETGELETFLAKPRSPLFLAAISKSNFVLFGDLIQGIFTIVFVTYLYGFSIGMKTLLSSSILIFAFTGVVILVGSFSFFSSRGSSLSYVCLNVMLTLSIFPIAKALKGREKWILYLTPLLMTATLPRLTALVGSTSLFLASLIATLSLFLISVLFFNFGLKKYKAKNYIILNE